MRTPYDLELAIKRHKEVFGSDPLMVSLNGGWLRVNRASFKDLHALCCNRGFLYRGIPCVITSSTAVDDFLIGY